MTAPDIQVDKVMEEVKVEAPLPASEASSSDALFFFRRQRRNMMEERLAAAIERVESYMEQTVMVPNAVVDMLRLLYDAYDLDD